MAGVPAVIYTVMSLGVTFIDYDHDGDLDLYVTQPSRIKKKPESNDEKCPPCRSLWPNPDLTLSSNVIWRNNSDGSFTNVTDATGLDGSFRNIAAVGTDYNNDRAVDLLIRVEKRRSSSRIRVKANSETGAI